MKRINYTGTKQTLLLAVLIASMSLSACAAGTPKETLPAASETFADASGTQDTPDTTADDILEISGGGYEHTLEDLLPSFVGAWQLNSALTEKYLKTYDSLQSMFGTGLGSYGASMEIDEDGSFRYYIGIGLGGTGKCEAGDDGLRVAVTPYEEHSAEEEIRHLKLAQEQSLPCVIMEYDGEDLYWTPDETALLNYEQDGKTYQKVEDLKDGGYRWARVLTQAAVHKDQSGNEQADYDSQMKTFENLENKTSLQVRRFDNLLYSAGDHLIFEYDGTVNVSKKDDLYHPVLTFDIGSTHGIVTRVPGGYMVGDDKACTISFYDEAFQPMKSVTGYRYLENGTCYKDGLMAVRDMETGLMGFMDESGDIAIPCEYAYVSDFSNGCASVLANAQLISYTEDNGTVPMFDAKGGQWGIINTSGSYVLEPSDRFANTDSSDPGISYYCGARRFSLVRADKTVDFLAIDEDQRVIETVKLP